MFEGGIFDAEADVVEESVVEKDRFLVDIADQCTEFRKTERANVVSVDRNAAAGHVMEARNEVYQRTLAASALPHEGNRLSTAHGEAHPANDFGVFALAVGIFVGKTHVIESDIIAKCFDVCGMFGFANGILGQENFIDALHRSHPFGNGVRCLRKIFQRLDDTVENHYIEDEGRRINRTVVREDQGAAVPQNEDNQTGAEKFAHGMS